MNEARTVTDPGFRWGAWMTIVWLVVIVVVTFAVILAAAFGVIWVELLLEPAGARPQTADAIVLYVVKKANERFAFFTAMQGLLILEMVFLLTRSADRPARARMLGLTAIARGKCAIWVIGGLATVVVLGELPKLFVDIGETEALGWLASLNPGWIDFVVIAFIAPLTEELLFRGFVYGGLSQSLIGPIGAILISSAIWAVLHLQYSWIIVAIIFAYGITFGVMRWKSGSLWPPIVAHCAINLYVCVVYFSGLFKP